VRKRQSNMFNKLERGRKVRGVGGGNWRKDKRNESIIISLCHLLGIYCCLLFGFGCFCWFLMCQSLSMVLSVVICVLFA